MRAAVVFLFVVGFMASVLTNVSGGSSSASDRKGGGSGTLADASSGEASTIAALKAKNDPKFNNQDGSIELQREDNGHFYADVRINGAPIRMMIDTGASGIALSREDAQLAGIATSIGMTDVVGEGASGEVHGQWVRLDRVELGPLSASGLDAAILDGGQQSLLGQSFLRKFGKVQIEDDKMVLR